MYGCSLKVSDSVIRAARSKMDGSKTDLLWVMYFILC